MSLTDFHFIRPYWFIALLPIAILIILSVRHKLARGNWSEVCDDALLPFILQDSDKNMNRRWSSITVSLASVLAIIALAGPTWERLPTPVFRNDAAVVIVLDLSRSMNATDIKPSRLIRARYKVADILQQRQDGLTALIAYAGDAFTVSPLTEDTATISNQINALNTDIMPSQGSNTSAALKQAVALLQQAGQSQGSILLITDGIHAQVLDQASAILGNYKLSILGIGTSEGAPVKLADGGFLKDRQGNIVVPKLDPSELISLARSGGGLYQTISSDDHDITGLMTQSARTTTEQTAEDNDRLVEQWVEKGPWLLLILLPLAAVYFRKGLLVVPLIAVMSYPQESDAFEWPYLWQTQDQQAQQAFNQQRYEQAAAQFQSPEWQAASQFKAEQYEQAADTLQPLERPSADVYYNQATSLAKAGKLDASLDIYNKALQLEPSHEDALYNKKLVEEAMKEQQQDQQKDEQSKQGDNNQQDQENKPSDQQQSDDQQSKSDPSDSQQDKQPQDTDDQTKQNQQDNQDENSQQKSESDKEQEAKEGTDSQQDNETDAKDSPQQAEQSSNDEEKQAQEQWLKRIPDDPAGLLKRKFKYQYNQRNQSSQQEQTW